jgi:hypothetical protein
VSCCIIANAPAPCCFHLEVAQLSQMQSAFCPPRLTTRSNCIRHACRLFIASHNSKVIAAVRWFCSKALMLHYGGQRLVLAPSGCLHLQRSYRILVTNAGESISMAPSVPSLRLLNAPLPPSTPECPKFIPATPLLAAADVAAQQLRVQFAEQIEVVSHNPRLRAFGESSQAIHGREQPPRRERGACRHDIQLPMQLLDEQQRVIISTCGRVRRQQQGRPSAQRARTGTRVTYQTSAR